MNRSKPRDRIRTPAALARRHHLPGMEKQCISEEHLDEFNRALQAQRRAAAAMEVISHDLREAYGIQPGDKIDEYTGRILRAPAQDVA